MGGSRIRENYQTKPFGRPWLGALLFEPTLGLLVVSSVSRPCSSAGLIRLVLCIPLFLPLLGRFASRIVFSSLATCWQPLAGETECPVRPRPAKGSTARGPAAPTAPTRAIEPRSLAGAPAPCRRLFAGVPAAVGSRRPSLRPACLGRYENRV